MPNIADGVSAADQQALLAAIVHSFGDCTCRSFHFISGQRVWLNQCPAHQFLNETDRGCSRIQHLAFARAMVGKWQRDEQTHSGEDPVDRMRRELGW